MTDQNDPRKVLTIGALLCANKTTSQAPRSLSAIAREIRANWPKPYFGAVPYLQAMATMGSPSEDYGLDSGKSIVLYFLANANTWRGDVARRVKAELKDLIK